MTARKTRREHAVCEETHRVTRYGDCALTVTVELLLGRLKPLRQPCLIAFLATGSASRTSRAAVLANARRTTHTLLQLVDVEYSARNCEWRARIEPAAD